MVTGEYIGDGLATQAVVGIGFQPRVVRIIRQVTNAYDGLHKATTDGVNSQAKSLYGATRYEVDHIISLDADGFTVGDGTGFLNLANVNGVTYTYIAYE